MERRYLVAILALAATFAIFSREFRSGHVANLPCPRAKLQAEIACAKRYLADQLVAKFRPFVDRGVPEEQQMVAELNLPVLAAANEKLAETQVVLAQQTAQRNCESAMRAQERALRVQERELRAAERAQERAADINIRIQARAQEMNQRAALRAQEVGARALQRAQRAWEKSQRKFEKSPWVVVEPYAPTPPVPPLPIDFQVSMPADFDQQVQAAVESRVAVKCVRAQVAAQQFRTVMIQRANQNMKNNVHVVVSTQDVSGLGTWLQSPSSRGTLHQVERNLQRLEDKVTSTIDRAFATL